MNEQEVALKLLDYGRSMPLFEKILFVPTNELQENKIGSNDIPSAWKTRVKYDDTDWQKRRLTNDFSFQHFLIDQVEAAAGITLAEAKLKQRDPNSATVARTLLENGVSSPTYSDALFIPDTVLQEKFPSDKTARAWLYRDLYSVREY